jgi:hypothetical protein
LPRIVAVPDNVMAFVNTVVFALAIPGQGISGLKEAEVVTVIRCTTLLPRVLFDVHVGVTPQLAEYEVPSLHSQPHETVGVAKVTFGALPRAAAVIPVVSLGFRDPYSAPACAAFCTSRPT